MLRPSVRMAVGGLLCAAALLQFGLAQLHDGLLAPLARRNEDFALDQPAARGLARRDRKDTSGKGNDLTILLTSDSHGADNTEWDWGKHMPDADVLIHCGDISNEGKIEEYKKVLKFFMRHSAKLKIFIGGNHDFPLDRKYFPGAAKKGDPIPEELRNGDAKKTIQQAYALFQTPEALKAGVKLLPEGLHNLEVLTMKKQNVKFRIFVSPYTPEFHGYAFARPKGKGGYNTPGLRSHIPDGPRRPHFVITHGPPEGILDKTVDGKNEGEPSLKAAMARVQPLFHAFGHIHEAAGVLRMKWADKSQTKVTDNTMDLTQPAGAVKQGDTTLFLNVAQRNLDKQNKNPWKLLKIKWRGTQKGPHAKDKNDPSRAANKLKGWFKKPNNHA